MTSEWPKLVTPAPQEAEALAALVRLARSQEGGRNGAAWASKAAILEPGTLQQYLASQFGVGECEVSYWLNVMQSGGSLERHHHRLGRYGGDNHYSAVYYAAGNAAEIVFFHEIRQRLNPTPGALLLFPADLEHAVPRWQGEGERVSLVFNVRQK